MNLHFEGWKGDHPPVKKVVEPRKKPAAPVVEEDREPIEVEMDLRGLHCPVPVLRTQSRMAKLKAGDVVRVLASDPSSWNDFPLFAKRKGYDLFSAEKVDGDFVYCLRK